MDPSLIHLQGSPLVSVVIPTYNQVEFIGDAVASALAQDYPHLEVVVADDASTQQVAQALQHFRDPRLRYERSQTNLGRVGNYRRGLYELARGDWVINLDGDDYLSDPGFVSEAVRRAWVDPRIVIVAARCTTLSRHGTELSPSPGDRDMEGIDVIRSLPQSEFLFMHLATMYRRSAALSLDFYRSPVISSDWESLYRLALHGRVAFMDRNVGVWRIHGHNETRASDWRMLSDNLTVWPSVLRCAAQQGMDTRDASVICRRCLARFGALHLPAVMRSKQTTDVYRYLRALGNLSWPALASALLRPPSMARLSLGLLGYYRRRTF